MLQPSKTPLPENITVDKTDDETRPPAPSIPPPDTPPAGLDARRSTNNATSTVSRPELRALQKDSCRVLDGWAAHEHMINATAPSTPDLGHYHAPLPRRSERITEKAANSDAAHLLVQADITESEKLASYQNERDA